MGALFIFQVVNKMYYRNLSIRNNFTQNNPFVKRTSLPENRKGHKAKIKRNGQHKMIEHHRL